MSSRVPRIVAAIAGLAFLLAPTTPAARAQALHLTGRGGDSDWVETPVVVQVKAPIAAGAYVLEDGRSTPIPAAVFLDGDERWLGAVLPKVAAGQAVLLCREAATIDRLDRGGRDPLPPSRRPPGGDDRRSAADDLSHESRQQAVLLPDRRPDRRIVHAGVSHGGRAGRGSRPSASAVVLVHSRQCQRDRFLVGRERQGDHPGEGASGRRRGARPGAAADAGCMARGRRPDGLRGSAQRRPSTGPGRTGSSISSSRSGRPPGR